MLLQAAHNEAIRERWKNILPALFNQTANLGGVVGDDAINTPVEQLVYDVQVVDLFGIQRYAQGEHGSW